MQENTNQENKQETPEQFQEVDFQRVSKAETLAPERVNIFLHMKNDSLFQDKQKQNRVKGFIEVNDLMDQVNKDSKE